MKIWVLEDGERCGPYESYLIRDRVESGELDGGAQVWYEGAEGWVRLDEVPLMRSLFEGNDEPVTEDEVKDVAVRLDEIVKLLEPPKLHMTRRFFARFFDGVLYLSLILAMFQSVEVLPKLGVNLWTNLLIGFGYVLVDAGMTHVWRSSPGKWIMGVRVTNAQGHAIGLGGSVMRSLRVWVLGCGMWLIPELALIVTWFMARRLKYFIWDLPKRYRVVCRPMAWWRVVAMILGFVLISVFLRLAMPENFVVELEERMSEMNAEL